jgi:hypothetical protein
MDMELAIRKITLGMLIQSALEGLGAGLRTAR